MALTKRANACLVLLDGVVQAKAEVITVTQGMGGRQLGTATFVLREGIVANRSLLAGGSADCEVFLSGSTGLKLLHFGSIGHAEINVGGDDRRVLTSRLEPFHLGSPHYAMREWWHEPVLNERELVFNPLIDGRVLGNRGFQPFGASYYFLDPMSMRSSRAEELLKSKKRKKSQEDQSAAEVWTLADAVLYLCQECNEQQRYVLNPSRGQVESIVPRVALVNWSVPHGLYLNDCLDQLLEPWGCSWYVKLGPGSRRQIVIVKRGVGDQKVVLLPIGGTPDHRRVNTRDAQVSWLYSAAINRVGAYGAKRVVEGTFELTPAWDAALDATPGQQLHKDDPQFGQFWRVWRDFVLNESGDYLPRVRSRQPRGYYDLAYLFGHATVPRRRVFGPCITCDELGTPTGNCGGFHVEISGTAGPPKWHSVHRLAGFHPIKLLDHECGIRFDGEEPPAEFIKIGFPNLRIRITASIEDDQRLTYLSPKAQNSPLRQEHLAILDLGEQYAFRQIHPSSRFEREVRRKKDVFGAKSNLRDFLEVDDTARLKAAADTIRATWDMADVAGGIAVSGLEGVIEYELGDVITEVAGRRINLSATPAGGGGRWPQVVGMAYDVQGQQRRLMLQTYRDR